MSEQRAELPDEDMLYPRRAFSKNANKYSRHCPSNCVFHLVRMASRAIPQVQHAKLHHTGGQQSEGNKLKLTSTYIVSSTSIFSPSDTPFGNRHLLYRITRQLCYVVAHMPRHQYHDEIPCNRQQVYHYSQQHTLRQVQQACPLQFEALAS